MAAIAMATAMTTMASRPPGHEVPRQTEVDERDGRQRMDTHPDYDRRRVGRSLRRPTKEAHRLSPRRGSGAAALPDRHPKPLTERLLCHELVRGCVDEPRRNPGWRAALGTESEDVAPRRAQVGIAPGSR